MCYMIERIPESKAGHFRWHDAGDLQSIEHLEKIVDVAKRLPKIRFWLPTRERGIVRAYNAQFGPVPRNLALRVSTTMVDGPVPKGFALTSGVHSKGTKPPGRECPAYKQGNQCRSCRACWDRRVKHVSYKRH
jgi:hypothetical protein